MPILFCGETYLHLLYCFVILTAMFVQINDLVDLCIAVDSLLNIAMCKRPVETSEAVGESTEEDHSAR